MTGTDHLGEERDFGLQPLAEIMERHGLVTGDLVEASKDPTEPARGVSHKLVSRAIKGRRLSPKVRQKVVDALNAACGESYGPRDAFSYLKPKP